MNTLFQYLLGRSRFNIFQYLLGWLGANPPIYSNTCREAAPGDQHTRFGGPRDHVHHTKSWIRMAQITPKPHKMLKFAQGCCDNAKIRAFKTGYPASRLSADRMQTDAGHALTVHTHALHYTRCSTHTPLQDCMRRPAARAEVRSHGRGHNAHARTELEEEEGEEAELSTKLQVSNRRLTLAPSVPSAKA